MLKKVKLDITSYPQLALPVDPDHDIWSYYILLEISPLVLDNLLVMIPLIDKSLSLAVYKAYSLPIIHPKLKVAF